LVCEKSELFASVCAIARALPLYHTKTAATKEKNVTVEFYVVDAESKSPTAHDIQAFTTVSGGVRMAARIVDTPCADMHTDKFIEEVRRVGTEVNAEVLVIQGEELRERGFGGIYNVGKAATNAPALAVLSHRPAGATATIAWVGKGIVFDTGGLCIKTKTGMCGMKRDCGGAAGVLGAFYTAVKMGFSENLHALFCLADNAVGPNSLRPDDIITMYSGKTVEINNTDAEGRLVLGDGVAYAQKDLKADVIVDMATLTGASGIATGRYHASIVTNSENWELYGVKAGQSSGDLVHPMLYCPELHFNEFASTLADIKNSVADRSNAQASCAGLFIASHIGFDYSGVWFHIDMAYPVSVGERATGYGVALLSTLFGRFSSSEIIQSIAPSVVLCDAMETDIENSDSVKKMKVT
ncbi:hypothetical protein ScPMuIL_008433, partial [Solemya velum]